MENVQERRRNLRVSFKTSVCIRPLHHDVPAIMSDHTRDISLRGLYCYTKEKLPVGTPCEVELRLSGSSSDLKLFMQADVVRSDEKGLALQFNEVDLDSMIHLKNILYYNSGEPDKIDQELASQEERG